ncbi:hypothetical protein, partial [Mesorhizobium sp. M2E.F.Ca.ET.154.01.1.1]|uniref:hypothetical protein n=1 Tax=Mesorhizobium sp. M2E.F.Ca.ET.154.01.1.1 TaxID=2500521 RepID=UPI001AEDB032
MSGYWFGTCGVTGKVTPFAAGGVVGFAGVGAAGAAAGAVVAPPFDSGVVVAAPPDGTAGAV